MEHQERVRNLAGNVVRAYLAAGLRIATAESMTGGLVAGAITGYRGASGVFAGGVVAYTEAVKREVLHVDPATIVQHGLVSSRVAEAMALGALNLMEDADVALGVTGAAGPDAHDGAEPGTAWLAVAIRGHNVIARELCGAGGDREAIRIGAVEQALRLLIEVAPFAAEVAERMPQPEIAVLTWYGSQCERRSWFDGAVTYGRIIPDRDPSDEVHAVYLHGRPVVMLPAALGLDLYRLVRHLVECGEWRLRKSIAASDDRVLRAAGDAAVDNSQRAFWAEKHRREASAAHELVSERHRWLRQIAIAIGSLTGQPIYAADVPTALYERIMDGIALAQAQADQRAKDLATLGLGA
jgi:nicotinamide-nucleotide amidase